MSVRWEKTGSAEGIADGGTLKVSCPVCGAAISTTYGEARRNPTLRCSKGHSVELKASSLDDGLGELEKGLDDLFRWRASPGRAHGVS